MTSSINSNDTSSHSNSELTTIDQNSNFKSNHQNFSLISFDHLGSFPISSVMNQPKNQNITSTAFTAIRSSIPINLKPTNLSSLVNLQSSSQSSILAPSHKRSNPPQIKLSEPPKINLSDFDPYLKQIQTEWSRWEKNLNINSNLNQNSNHSSSSTVHNLSNLSLNSNPINLINSKLPSISIVPNIFFKKSFSLSDPETFDLITQTPSFNSNLNQNSNSSINHQSDSSSILDLATDQILQEKLSHYLDIVQLHLVQEISLRSTSFFSALGNLQSLHAQTAFCRSQMENLIHQLDQLKSSVAQRGLDLIRFSIRRKNITKLDHALNKLKDIWNTLRSIEELIQSGDWLTALNLIESLESIWNSSRFNSLSTNHLAPTSTFHSSSSPSISLRLNKIKALAYLPDQLSSFRNIISKALEAELTSILSHDLKVNLQNFLNLNPFESDLSQPKSPSHPLSASLEEIMPKGFFQTQQSTKEKLKDRIRLTFDGLARVAGLDKAILSWRQAVIKQTRETIKNVLSDVIELEQEDQDNNSDISLLDSKDKQSILNEKTVNLSRSLKELLPDQFLKISKETYQQLLSCLQIVDTQSFALLDLANDFNAQNIHSNASTYQPETSLKSNSSENPRINSQDVEKSSSQMIDIENLSLKLSGVVQDTAELANVRFAKVIGVRSEIHAQLNSVEFFDIFHTSWQFVVRCEVISRRMIVALRAVLVRQAKAFLQSFHQKKITESAKVLEQEQWTQVEIPSQIQKIVNAIISSAMEDSKLFILPKQSSIVPSELTESPKTIPLSKQLDIEGTPFHTVSAVLESLNTLADYLKIVINCSILTTDTMGKIIEFLKAFNSRTCQVVLGAGAIRSAGLKNITAKHL
ncbi:hypothetical protein O181_073936, partial [Austropuccinia psidii MF-1]|nr:hypothetical protein [Austropuccinia psidii MF-1]